MQPVKEFTLTESFKDQIPFIYCFIVNVHVGTFRVPTCGKGKEELQGKLLIEMVQKLHITSVYILLPLTFHQPKLSHITTSNCEKSDGGIKSLAGVVIYLV